MRALKAKMRLLRRTPLHPQWHCGDGAMPVQWLRDFVRGVVLDIGCANRWAQAHLHPDCRYLALDHPAIGRSYGAQPHVYATAEALPFAAASVDSVLLIEVAEHLPRPAAAFAEIARVLRPGGRLLASVPFLYPVHDAPHDYQRWTEHGLRTALAAAGLAVERMEPPATRRRAQRCCSTWRSPVRPWKRSGGAIRACCCCPCGWPPFRW